MADSGQDGTPFDVRFLIDEFFIADILKDKAKAIKIISKLSDIHKKSRYYPMEHNLIFDESFRASISDKKLRGAALLGAMHPTPYPDFLAQEKDFPTKAVKYSINLANSHPWRIYILTSKEHADDYLKNTHYDNDGVKTSIRIAYGAEAENVIDVVSSQKP